MPIEFPIHILEKGLSLEDPQNICICGHKDYYHFEDEGCLRCTCLTYRFEQTLTRKESWELENALYNRAESIGNIE